MRSASSLARMGVLLAVLVMAPQLHGAEDGGLERNVVHLEHADAAEIAETLTRHAWRSVRSPGQIDRQPRICADLSTNSLVIESSPQAFAALEAVIAQLDSRRPQVLLESVALDVRGDEDRTFGAEPLVATLHAIRPFTGTIVGTTVQILDPSMAAPASLPILEATIRLAANREELDVLLASTILTADNEEVSIFIPTTGGGRTAAGRSISSGSWDLAAVLGVTPQIREEDVVQVKIEVKEDAVAAMRPGERSFSRGTWLLRQGETLLLAGAMRELPTESCLGIPVLGALPVIGRFFRFPNGCVVQTTRVLMLAPRIQPAEPGRRPFQALSVTRRGSAS